ncbi:hypothetical protein B0H63DRAFT_459287 [Podospora didyma]|uniref:DUF7721 domain-containing protein n=1 Tax=Podospora didyma TaxID=330526 RepID=A0AAE0P5R6_9PEZI|nr:hypothetical protein B0H63DRAFT_459287 [Podospora didyma]
MDKFLGKVLGGDNDELQQHSSNLYQGGGNIPQGGAYPAGGGHSYEEDDDLRGAAGHASKHADEDTSFFSEIIGQLDQKREQVATEDLDEEDAVAQHKSFFDNSTPNPENATSSGMGAAAAMEALKLFTSSSSSSSQQPQSQSAFIGLAMSQASKLFDQQASAGKVSSGADKQSAVMKAGEMALKMYLKSHGSQGGATGAGGAGAGNNLSGLLGMASKFMQ